MFRSLLKHEIDKDQISMVSYLTFDFYPNRDLFENV